MEILRISLGRDMSFQILSKRQVYRLTIVSQFPLRTYWDVVWWSVVVTTLHRSAMSIIENKQYTTEIWSNYAKWFDCTSNNSKLLHQLLVNSTGLDVSLVREHLEKCPSPCINWASNWWQSNQWARKTYRVRKTSSEGQSSRWVFWNNVIRPM